MELAPVPRMRTGRYTATARDELSDVLMILTKEFMTILMFPTSPVLSSILLMTFSVLHPMMSSYSQPSRVFGAPCHPSWWRSSSWPWS